jgi:glutamate-1-semialdehyde 2,1-aminomutase
MKRILSERAFEEARQYIEGGVNSPVRALKAVGETPLFIDHAKGVLLTDIDGNDYIDFCLSWGVFIAGHANPIVQQAVQNVIANGTSYGIPTLVETRLAKKVSGLIPSMERVRFVNSESEAVMSAINVAQSHTKRKYILRFEGSNHGDSDEFLVAPFNDKEAVETIFKEYGDRIAAVIVEPVPANMGVVPEVDGFLHFLRTITKQHEALLIFDETITGFRLTLGGAQKYYGVTPDLTTLGKIVGGGFPAAAFGGRKDIMALLAPDGPLYQSQSGTLSGNPVAMTAGLATLNILSEKGLYNNLNLRAEKFMAELQGVLRNKGVVINSVGNMFTPFFQEEKPHNFKEANKSNLDEFARFWRYMLSNGVYLSPSQFSANFVSIQHTEDYLSDVLEIAKGY